MMLYILLQFLTIMRFYKNDIENGNKMVNGKQGTNQGINKYFLDALKIIIIFGII